MKFLETNGKKLEEYYKDISEYYVAKFCPNLKKLFVMFEDYDLDLRLNCIFQRCQYLEGMVFLCGNGLNEKDMLEAVAWHSPKNFYELKIHKPEFCPEDLESFFVSWKNR